MSEQTAEQATKQNKGARKPWFGGDNLAEQLVTLLISLTIILVAVGYWLESNAWGIWARTTRDAQNYAVQAMSRKTSGEMTVGYAYSDAFRLWFEADFLAFLAEEGDDPNAARRYAAARDGLTELSPLLNPPYFDPADPDKLNVTAFEVDTYLVGTTALAERFANASAMSSAWEDRANAYTTHTILLASALFLYALATTANGKVRWLFVGVGALITNVVVVWMVILGLTPVHSLPGEAMLAYARGVGLAHQGDLEGAIEAFDQALTVAPDYANAYYKRGNTLYDLGDLDGVASDYEAALQAGKTGSSVPWNLGWTYYVLGRQDEAVRMTEKALEMDPDQVGLHFNLGLAHLADGSLEAARMEYAAGMDLAASHVAEAKAAGAEPPTSLWWYLGTAVMDLSNLLNCMYDQVCKEAPPYETVAAPDARDLVIGTADELHRELKSLSVALEYTGQLPGDPVAAEATAFEFAEGMYDDERQLVDYTPLSSQTRLRFGQVLDEDAGEFADMSIGGAGAAGDVFVLFDYEGMRDGQLVVVKVYVDGREVPGLRLVEEWALGFQGQAALPFIPGSYFALSPGDYRVELYVDSQLIQQGGFTIE